MEYEGPIAGHAIKSLTVDPFTNRPVVALDTDSSDTVNSNSVFKMNADNSWSQIPSIKAYDLAIGNDGTLVYVSTTPY